MKKNENNGMMQKKRLQKYISLSNFRDFLQHTYLGKV